MYTPHVPKPTTAAGSGGGRRSSDTAIREPAPFIYNKQADHADDVACTVCDAPLHVYEVKEHQGACDAIFASDGKDKEFPQAQDEPAETPEED
jgi:hypothetical protein